MHPNPSPDAAAHSLGLPDNLIDFTADTNCAVAQMHCTNRFCAHTKCEVHLLSRRRVDPSPCRAFCDYRRDGLHRGRRATRHSCRYVPPNLLGHGSLCKRSCAPHAAHIAGIDQVLYGTDFPYLRRDLAVNSKPRIFQSSELNDLGRRDILGDNAAGLFPRLRRRFRTT